MYTDGVLELIGDSSSAFIYAYSADADTSEIGSVFFRESTDETLLDLSTSLQGLSFADSPPESFTSLFIATWFYVGYDDGGTDLVKLAQTNKSALYSRLFLLYYQFSLVRAQLPLPL